MLILPQTQYPMSPPQPPPPPPQSHQAITFPSQHSCKTSCFRILIIKFDADLGAVPVALGLALSALWFGRGGRRRGRRRLLHGHGSAQQRRALTRQEIGRRRQEIGFGRDSERALAQDHAVLLGTRAVLELQS